MNLRSEGSAAAADNRAACTRRHPASLHTTHRQSTAPDAVGAAVGVPAAARQVAGHVSRKLHLLPLVLKPACTRFKTTSCQPVHTATKQERSRRWADLLKQRLSLYEAKLVFAECVARSHRVKLKAFGTRCAACTQGQCVVPHVLPCGCYIRELEERLLTQRCATTASCTTHQIWRRTNVIAAAARRAVDLLAAVAE